MTSSGPGWSAGVVVAVLVVAVLVVAAALCAAGLLRPSTWADRRVAAAEANHLLMALAMVAMSVPATAGAVPPAAGVTVSVLLAAGWAAVAVRRRGAVAGSFGCATDPRPLVLADVAMAVMYGIGPLKAASSPVPADGMGGTGGMAGMGGMEGHAAVVPGSGSGPLVLGADVVAIVLALGLFARAGAAAVTVLAPRVGQRADAVLVAVAAGGTDGPVGEPVGEPQPAARDDRPSRLQLGCEALMALVMAWMLLSAL